MAPPSGSWTCTFDDEFNGTSLDTSKWSPMTTFGSGYTTGPLGHRVCYLNNPQTISESGGYLDLSLIPTAQSFHCTGTNLYSFGSTVQGGMATSFGKFSQQYGYFAVRSSMPPSDIAGLQETLWLFPNNWKLYGDSGEIDFGEFYSNYPNNDIPTIHFPGSKNDPNSTSFTCAIPGQATAGQFHTYSLLWTPTSLTTYYDGVACFTDVYGPYVVNPDTAPEPFTQPFFLNLTAALGSYNGDTYNDKTQLPATTQIDWVRAWQFGS